MHSLQFFLLWFLVSFTSGMSRPGQYL
jgi:hypothetical protein